MKSRAIKKVGLIGAAVVVASVLGVSAVPAVTTQVG